MAVTDSPRDCRARAMAKMSGLTAAGRAAVTPALGLGGAQPVERALTDQVTFYLRVTTRGSGTSFRDGLTWEDAAGRRWYRK